jgi:hypothetical protein
MTRMMQRGARPIVAAALIQTGARRARPPPTAEGEGAASSPDRSAGDRRTSRTTWPTDGQTNDTQTSRDGLSTDKQ